MDEGERKTRKMCSLSFTRYGWLTSRFRHAGTTGCLSLSHCGTGVSEEFTRALSGLVIFLKLFRISHVVHRGERALEKMKFNP